MKQCPNCNQTKSLEEFYCQKASKDGHQSWCKACHGQSYRRWRKRNLKKARRDTRIRCRGRYPHSKSAEQLARNRILARGWSQASKEGSAARDAVKNAVRRGEKWASNRLQTRKNNAPLLFRPPCCPWCGRREPTERIEAHHYDGYERQKALTGIIWVCRLCHREIDVLCHEAVLDHQPAIEGFKRFLREHGVLMHKRIGGHPQRLPAGGYNHNGGSNAGDKGDEYAI